MAIPPLRVPPSGPLTPATGGSVESVFGRTGHVVAETGDYGSSQITNQSTISGASVTDAINALSISYAQGKFTSGAIVAPGDFFILDPLLIAFPGWERIHNGGPGGAADAILPPQSLVGKVLAFRMSPLFQALTNDDPITMKISLYRYNATAPPSSHFIDMGQAVRQSALDGQELPIIIETTIDLTGLTQRDECQLYFQNVGADLLRASDFGSFNIQGQG